MKLTHTALGFLVVGLAGLVGETGSGQAHAAPGAWAIGGNFGISPTGKLKTEFGNQPLTADTATAFSLGGLLDYRANRNVSIGFAPNLIFGVKDEDADSSGTQLDLPLRIAVGGPVAPKVRLYGFVSPGYSVLFPPDDFKDAGFGNPSGFSLGFGGGAGFRVGRNLTLTTELSYQFRWLSTDIDTAVGTVHVPVDVNYLTFAIGLVAGI